MSPRDYQREYKQQLDKLDFLQIRIPRELKAKLKDKAQQNSITVSQWLLNQIKSYVGEPSE